VLNTVFYAAKLKACLRHLKSTPLRRPRDWIPKEVHHIQADLLDRDDVQAKLSLIANEVTHVFYVTWVLRSSEEENIKDNSAMLRNLLGEAGSWAMVGG
jgi:hypothetical protein